MATPAWIGLGSNLGDRRAILDSALAALDKAPGVVVLAVSPYHETQPVGGPPGQGPFLNAAAHLETDFDPHQLLAVLQTIEDRAGRVRTARWGERTLDLDLLIYGTKSLDTDGLKLPHPRLPFRRFVLAPLAEIAPTLPHPVIRRTVADLLAGLDRRPRLIAIDGSKGPRKSAVFERLVEQLPGFGISEADLEPAGSGVGHDSPSEVSGGIVRKAEAIRASRWAVETLRVPWIVTDYFLNRDILRSSMQDPRKDHPPPGSKRNFEAHRVWKHRMAALLDVALPPMMVLVLPGDRETRPLPRLAAVPRLRPESDQPDAIVAEVLATCQGIKGA